MSFRLLSALGLLLLGASATLTAQDRRDEQFYYPGKFNWQFLENYPEGARLFNAFDYGHAILYEQLYTKRGAERDAALEQAYQYLTTNLLIRPPRFAVAEEVIEPAYAKLAWQAKQMFDWAHVLHRQIYDVYADERFSSEARDSLIERLTDYYLSRKEYAFTTEPKSMALMDKQYFSQVFRKEHPKFNGLIWAYHWLQVGLYEPLIAGKTPAEKQAGVKATLARFWSMLEDPPANFPKMMPMTSAIAPTFSARHPRAAVIFDNLHTLHDIISDVLAAETVPRDRKRAVIYQQLAEFRDGTRNVIGLDEWRNMAELMGGIGMMGGPATGLLPAMPADTMKMPHVMPRADTVPSALPGHQHPAEAARSSPDSMLAAMLAVHERMLADPVIRRRVAADTALRRMLLDLMPAEHREQMDSLLRVAPASNAILPKTRAPRPAAKPSAKTAPMPPGHVMPPAKPAPKKPAQPRDSGARPG